MPQVVAAVVAAVAAITWTQIATALISMAISSLASAAISALTKPSKQPQRGAQMDISIDPAADRTVVLGRTRVAGSLAHIFTSGSKNKYLVRCIILSECECEGVFKYWLGDKAYTFHGNGAQPEFNVGGADHMWMYWAAGTNSQTAFNGHAALSGADSADWDANRRGIGMSYVIVIQEYDEEVYPGGMETIAFDFAGVKTYHLNEDTSEGGSGTHVWGTPSTYTFTDLALTLCYHFLRGFWVGDQLIVGAGLDTVNLPSDLWIDEINICGELVAFKGGGSEQRYRACAVVTSQDDWDEVVDEFARSVAGKRIDLSGRLYIRAGAARTPAVTVTESDMSAAEDFWVRYKRPVEQLYNSVAGTFTDTNLGYLTGDYPGLEDAAAIAEDGQVREKWLPLPFVYRHQTAQRIRKIFLNKARLQIVGGYTAHAWLSGLEAGDWHTLDSTREGWTGYTVDVTRTRVGRDRRIEVEFEQEDAAVYAWNPATDELDHDAAAAAGTSIPAATTVSGFTLTAVTVQGNDGISVPGIHFQWTAPDDPSIQRMKLEYRKVSDSTVMVAWADPASASFYVTAGIQALSQYEGRMTAIPEPRRAATATAYSAAVNTNIPSLPAVAINDERGFSADPFFQLWTTASSVPSGITATALTIVKNTANKDYGNWVLDIEDMAAAAANLLVQGNNMPRIPPEPSPIIIALDIDIELVSGDFKRCGAIFRLQYNGGTTNYYRFFFDLFALIPSPVVGRRYRRTFFARIESTQGAPTGAPTSCRYQFMVNNSLLTGGANSAKRLRLHYVQFRSPTDEELKTVQGMSSAGAANIVGAGAVQNQNGGAPVPISRGIQRGICFDGTPITFAVPYDTTPYVQFGSGGKIFDSTLTGNQIREDTAAVTLTGFTPSLKLKETVGATTLQSATDTTGATTRDFDKPTAGNAWNNVYRVTGTIALYGTSPLPGIEPYEGSCDVVFYTDDGGGFVERGRQTFSLYGFTNGVTRTYDMSRSAAALGQHGGKEAKVMIVATPGTTLHASTAFNSTATFSYYTATAPASVSRTTADQPVEWLAGLGEAS